MEKQVIPMRRSAKVKERTKASKDGGSDLYKTSHDRK